MKKLFLGLVATILFSTVGHAQQKVTLQSTITAEEYKTMDDVDKKLINYIDASIGALKGLNLNGKPALKYVATISISEKDSKLDNNVVLSESEGGDTSSAQSCSICDFGSGLRCYRKIRTQLGNGPVVITVELVGDCAQLTW